MSEIGFVGAAECRCATSGPLCYFCQAMAERDRRYSLIAECDCGLDWTIDDIDAFRGLALDSVLSFEKPKPRKIELRTCECGRIVGIHITRDGEPLRIRVTK